MAGDVKVLMDFTTKGISNIDKSLKGVDKRMAEVEKATKQTTSSFSNLGEIALKVGSIFGAIKGFKVAIDAALEQEKALNRLNVAMKTSGEFSAAASKDFLDYASKLEAVSVVAGDVALNQLALAKSFGATNEQAKQIVTVAADLSAAMGIDMESAVRNVAKTLGGFAGELGETIPALKTLGAEALQAGKGVTLLGERFKGSAEGEIKTFDGSLKQLGNSFGNLLITLGDFVVKNELVLEVLKDTTKGIVSAIGAIKTFSSVWSDIVDMDAFTDWASGSNEVDAAIKATGGTVTKAVEQVVIVSKKRNLVQKESLRLEAELQAMGDKTHAKDLIEIPKKLEAIKNAEATRRKLLEERLKTAKNLEERMQSFGDKVHSRDMMNHNEKMEALRREGEQRKKIIQIGLGAAGAAAGGASFSSVASGAAGATAEMFLPGSGAVVQPLMQLLGGSKEQVKETVRAFTDGAVVFVENLITNIPLLITELANSIPRVTDAFIAATPRIIENFVKQMPGMAIALSKAFIFHMPEIAMSFGEALVKEAPKFIEKLIEEITGAFGDLLGGGGILGDALGGIPIVGGLTKPLQNVPVVGGLFKSADSALVPQASSAQQSSSPQVVRTSVDFKGRTLADIMIELDRTGVRTRAS